MESIWKQTVHEIEPKQLSKVSEADAVVIGGGMAGILTTLFLQKQGVNTIVLEADRIGSGQTCNTTAKITSQHGLIYDKLIQAAGEEKASQYAAANETAISDYKQIVKEQNIACHFEEQPAYLYSTEDAEVIKREAEAAQKSGIQASFVTETDLPFPVAGAVKFEHQAQFHPLQFLYAIAKQVPVYEHTPVRKIEDHKIITNNGTIEANYIIMATHYPFLNRPGYYFMRMHQERSYVVAFEHAECPHGMYLGVDGDGLSVRSYEDKMLLGGGKHRTGENAAGGKYEMVRKQAARFWPNAKETTYWSAQDCMTLDGVPYIGQFSEETPNWYVATGFGKWGMTSSMVSARLISDAILGIDNPNREVFSPQRSSVQASAKNFLKDGIHAAKDLTKRIFQVPNQEIEELPAGHGGVVTYDGEKVGVYKDEKEGAFIVSVKCPHLGCQLDWNPDEKSWDCPCHGSRFDYKGNLIDNPAQIDLERI